MNRNGCGWSLAGKLVCTLAVAACLTEVATAGEPFQKFVDGLRDRKLYDVAVDYLNSMSNSPLISQEIKSTLAYEQGKTLIDWARDDLDVKNKTQNLEAARAKLEEFIKANSSHPLAGSAAMQLGNVLVLRGTMILENSAKPNNAAQKDAMLKQARDIFEEAKKVFKKSEEEYEKLVQGMKGIPPKDDAKWIERREEVRLALLQANLYSAAVLQEIAKTYKVGSAEHKKSLTDAADKYRTIYERWRTLMAGQLARIKQGQCIQDLGDVKTAIGLYADILNQPDLPAFRGLKAAALYRTQQCWLDGSQKNPELAYRIGKEFLTASTPVEMKLPDWMAIQYHTALAAKDLSPAIPDKEPARKKGLLTEAKELAKTVASVQGTYRDDARVLLKTLGADDDLNKEATTFVDAVERGQRFLEEMQVKQSAAKSAPNPEEAKKLNDEAIASRDKAVENFMLAMKLRDANTKIDEVNNCRYYLCFLNYQLSNHYQAAVLGEFLARKYPNSAGGRPGAKIALASYLQGYNDKTMPAETKQFDRDHMVELANYIAQRWKGELEAEEAWGILLSVAVLEKDLPGAEDFLSKIPEDGAKRGESELKLGQTYWGAYLTENRKDKEAEDRMPQTQIDKLLVRARELLEAGVAHSKASLKLGNPITQDMVYGALSLSQVYLNESKPDKAVELIEDKQLGPLTLVKANNPAATQPAGTPIPAEAYKTALRAFVETKQLDKAQQSMGELERLMAALGPAGQQQLASIYVSMGKALEEQIKSLKEAGKEDEAKAVTASFEVFLDKLREGAGANFSSLNWVAETFYSLGAGYDTTAPKPANDEAKAYYEKSLSTDEKIGTLVGENAAFVPNPDAMFAVKLRMARVYRRLARYKDAVNLIQTILVVKPMLVEAQIDAAKTYMDWGTTDKDYYPSAIFGARKDAAGQNIILGWIQLAARLQSALSTQQAGMKPEAIQTMRGWFFEARYNQAVVYAAMAQAEKDPAKKAEQLERGAGAITITARLTPDLAKPEWKTWRDKLDTQLKTIEKLQGKKPDGIAPLMPKDVAPAAPAAASPPAEAAASSKC